MTWYPESVISQHLHETRVLFSATVMWPKAQIAPRFLILRLNTGIFQQAVVIWLTELSKKNPKTQKNKQKKESQIHNRQRASCCQSNWTQHLTPLKSWCSDSETAFLVSSFHGKPSPCWSRTCLSQKRIILCFPVSWSCMGSGSLGLGASTQPGGRLDSLSPSISNLPEDGISICPEVTEPIRHRQKLQEEARVPSSKLHLPEGGAAPLRTHQLWVS